MKVKIKGRYIIGFNGTDHVIFDDGEVVYENDKILFVGHDFPGEVDEVIDTGTSVVSPGFIDLNALGDIDHDIVHIEADNRQKNLLWSEEYYLARSSEMMTPEEEAFKSLYAYSQLLLNGVTTAMPITSVFYKKWAETYEELEAAVLHASNLGLRIYLGPSYQSGIRVVKPNGVIEVAFDATAGNEGLDRAVKFVEKYDNTHNGLIKGMLAPERIESQTPEMLIRTKKYSEELNCPIRLHAAQGKFEYEEIHQKYGKTPIRHLYDLGFLGEKTGIPHAQYTSQYSHASFGEGDDLALLSETNTTVIHCPLVMGRHGVALESFAKYKRRGINLAIGTDTYPSDFFQNIRTGSMLSRIVTNEVKDSTYADLYRAATIGGANFLGRNDIGRLEKGAKADIIAIDLSGFHIGNIDDPIRTMFIAASGSDVKLSIINGRVVMKDRLIPGINLDELQVKGANYFKKLRASYMKRDYEHLSEDELFQGSFQRIKKIVNNI